MYLSPDNIKAAIDASPAPYPTSFPADLLLALGCTWGVGELGWRVHTSDRALAFAGDTAGLLAWLRDYSPRVPFADLSPMHRDRLVAAFVGPGLNLIRAHQRFAASQGCEGDFDAEIVEGIWDYARHAGWSYLETLESPAAVAAEALAQWSIVDGEGL